MVSVLSREEIPSLTGKTLFLYSSWHMFWIHLNSKELSSSTILSHFLMIQHHFPDSTILISTQDPLTLSWMFWEVSSSAFFSRRTPTASAFDGSGGCSPLRSRKRCRRSSGSSSTSHAGPPVLGSGLGWRDLLPRRKRSYLKGMSILSN